jgi:hypothetical protein
MTATWHYGYMGRGCAVNEEVEIIERIKAQLTRKETSSNNYATTKLLIENGDVTRTHISTSLKCYKNKKTLSRMTQ